MKAPRLRAWHKELKFMEYPESIFTRDNIHMLLNEEDYIWMKSTELTDERKIEIYEDDIVEGFLEWDNQSRYTVRGKVYFINGAFFVGNALLSKLTSKKIKGNIYENPELMEDK